MLWQCPVNQVEHTHIFCKWVVEHYPQLPSQTSQVNVPHVYLRYLHARSATVFEAFQYLINLIKWATFQYTEGEESFAIPATASFANFSPFWSNMVLSLKLLMSYCQQQLQSRI